jgi:DNA repair exonuclease SbcCD ATPase subunit
MAYYLFTVNSIPCTLAKTSGSSMKESNPTINTLTAIFSICDQLEKEWCDRQAIADREAEENHREKTSVRRWTNQDVKDRYGKGSFETLVPMIQLWKAQQLVRPEATQAVPTQVIDAMLRSLQPLYASITQDNQTAVAQHEKAYKDTLDALALERDQLSAEAESLRASHEAAQAKIAQLEEDISALTVSLGDTRSENSRLSDDNEQLNATVSELSTEVSSLKEDNQSQMEELQDRAIEIARLSKERDLQTAQLSELKSSHQQTLKALSDQREATSRSEVSATSLAQDNENLKASINQLKIALTDIEERCRHSALDHEQVVSAVKEELATQKGQNTVLSQRINEQKRDYEALRQELYASKDHYRNVLLYAHQLEEGCRDFIQLWLNNDTKGLQKAFPDFSA